MTPLEGIFKFHFQEIFDKDGWDHGDVLREARFFFSDYLPGRFIFLVGVWSREVEEELVRVRLGEEVRSVGDGFDLIELAFHEAVDGFDVGLPGIGGGGDGGVDLAGDALDGFGIGAGSLCEDVTDVLCAVIGLASRA
ncbi:MAG: hypothetical protein PHD74_03130 [Candidatus Krumholzibacteria bacterium]|nr:hypothetical protein [Candidatus Krumholzibacteria bacterium]